MMAMLRILSIWGTSRLCRTTAPVATQQAIRLPYKFRSDGICDVSRIGSNQPHTTPSLRSRYKIRARHSYRMPGPSNQPQRNLSHPVVAVNPDSMVVSPTPMPGNPDIIPRPGPIAWTMDVIGPVPHTNINYNCFGWRYRQEARHRCEN